MSEVNEVLGTFIRVYDDAGMYSDFPYSEELLTTFEDIIFGNTPHITALKLTNCVGAKTIMKAKSVASVYLSTPESRKNSYERDILWEELAKESKPTDWSS
jgi:hypothetical protein